jgi:predicted dehydrogenase
MAGPVRCGIVGSGWRAEFFLRLARLLPGEVELVGIVVRRPEVASRLQETYGVPTYQSVRDLLVGAKPDLAVTSVPWEVTPGVIVELVDAGVRVLAETPPAPDVAGLHALWAAVGSSGMVQVAEQYPRLPPHAARAEVVRSGVIGEATQVQLSSTHTYHAIALIRWLLGVGFAPVRIGAQHLHGPLVDPMTKAGWTHDDVPKRATTTVATLDFGDKAGVYDFTDNQWHNQLRHRRMVIRGSHGEIHDHDVIRLVGPEAIVSSRIERRQLGYDLNLDGFDTEHFSFDGHIMWSNPYLGQRLMDEDIAIASLLSATARWAADDGAPPYPLADGCHDHLLGLAIDEAAATGRLVDVADAPWAAT